MAKMIYTFRTFPFIKDLKEEFKDLFVFKKLNEDFLELSKKILEEKPKMIIGVARSNKDSTFQSTAINQFNSKKRINKDGEDAYLLSVLKGSPFRYSEKPTDSFCNWTMYKISEFIQDNTLKTQLAFIHVNESDLGRLIKVLKMI